MMNDDVLLSKILAKSSETSSRLAKHFSKNLIEGKIKKYQFCVHHKLSFENMVRNTFFSARRTLLKLIICVA